MRKNGECDLTDAQIAKIAAARRECAEKHPHAEIKSETLTQAGPGFHPDIDDLVVVVFVLGFPGDEGDWRISLRIPRTYTITAGGRCELWTARNFAGSRKG